ncbi:MAG: gliding motility-associated C-terminal domain-containing protein, partial [Flavobacteriales bacterium]|nr:gliding motility-associated C-terminal domain-containing protein [Flavobacteriales bacterium]
SISTSDPSGCPDLCVDFIDNSAIPFGEIVSRTWNFGDFQFSHEPYETHCYHNDEFDESAFYNIRFDIVSDSGCTTTKLLDSLIEVYPVTYADFEWTPDSVSTFDPEVHFIDKSHGAIYWDWDFGDTNQYSLSTLQNPDFTYSEHGYHDIMLITDNEYGCVDTIVRTIYIYADIRFYVPNAFTPDSDGKNEVFRGYGSDILEYQMKIFNRWGQLVFLSNDIDYAWDGRVRGHPAKAGVYVYEFIIKDLNYNPYEYVGHFTLLR